MKTYEKVGQNAIEEKSEQHGSEQNAIEEKSEQHGSEQEDKASVFSSEQSLSLIEICSISLSDRMENLENNFSEDKVRGMEPIKEFEKI